MYKVFDTIYRNFRKILQNYVTINTISELLILSAFVKTLKKAIKQRLLLLKIKKALIELRFKKLFFIRGGKKSNDETFKQNLYFFDITYYIKTLLFFKIKNDIYFNIVILINDDYRAYL